MNYADKNRFACAGAAASITRIPTVQLFVNLFLLIFLVPACSGFSQQAPALMPLPATVHFETGALPLTHRIRIQWKGYKDELLERAAGRFVANLNRRTGVDFVQDDSIDEAPVIIAIDCAAADPKFLTTSANENYEVKVSDTGVEIHAPGPTGVLRALATLLQLVEPPSKGFALREAYIEDRPRFAWRGIMIDVSRHFMPAALVEHELDAMELVKLNVLHLHLTDSESFSIESKVYPLVSKKGGLDGRYYTQDEVRSIVAYARDRGIRVVPEIEMPGHMKSWLQGYPELASGPGPFHLGSDYAGGDAALNPADERVYKFMDNLIGEIAGLFPDAYFHIGGDEVIGKQWARNADIQKLMKARGFKTKGQLQAYFTGRVNDIVRRHGKIMIGWDEVLDGDAPRSMAIEAWRSSRMTAISVKAGHATIVATPYYLDLMLPAGMHYANDPLDTNAWGITEEQFKASDKLGGLLTPAFVLRGDFPLSPAERQLVLGGEAQMWSEITTPEMLDAGLWPRCAAIAERFWSPRENQNADDMYRRLYSIDALLAAFGTNQYANRQRMLLRIAPQDPTPLETLASVVEPIKFLGHWHNMRGGLQPDQNTLADAALPESLVARRFCEEADALSKSGGSDKALVERLKGELVQWQGNHALLVSSVSPLPNWQPVLDTSADLRDLATIGLEAIQLLATNQKPQKEWMDATDRVLAKQQKYAEASAHYPDFDHPPAQPGSEVLIAILPGIQNLAQAAKHGKD